MASTDDHHPACAHTAVPFHERWELLKPIIKELYVDENMPLSRVQEIMRDQYGFDAM